MPLFTVPFGIPYDEITSGIAFAGYQLFRPRSNQGCLCNMTWGSVTASP